ncbi:MAG: M48 family metallopeptidase [Verrucomicrobiales bacterium]
MWTAPWFIAILLAIVVPYAVKAVASWLNLGALESSLPEDCSDIYDAEAYSRSQRYTRESIRLDLVQSTLECVGLLIFWLAGGFSWLDRFVRSFHLADIGSGLVGLSLMFLAGQALALPFSLYDTFVLEARYGFNKTTLATFIADRLKGLALGFALGLPVVALVLWLFLNVPHAWLWSWGTATAFSLILTFIAPKYLFPLFNKFTPLPDGELKDAIHRMAADCQFPLGEISVIDGSRRSTKANAFFAGFGKTKRIALYDTLVSRHSVPELVAVLAHEVGHFKRHHIWQLLVLGVLQTGILFFLLDQSLGHPQVFHAFGVAMPSLWLGFVLFAILYQPLALPMGMGLAALSRKNEFEADAFATQTVGTPRALFEALKKLARDNLANLTPHRFYVLLHHSHPPIRERLAALAAHQDSAKK